MPFDMSPTSVHYVFLISLTATAGLIAVWAALSRCHRLLRLAGFCTLPVAIWLAPAPELVSHLLLQMIVISGLIIGLRFIAEAPHGRTFAKLPKVQFGLARLFYATFLSALLAAAVSIVAPQVAGRSPTLLLHWLVQQASMALPIVGAACFARCEGSRKKRAAVLLGGCLAGSLGLCALPSRSDETFSTFDAWGLDIDLRSIEIGWWYIGLVPLLLGVVTAGILWKARRSLGQPAAGAPGRVRLPGAVASLMMAAFVALPACYMYYELARDLALKVDVASPSYEKLSEIGEQLANSATPQQQRYALIQEVRQSLAMPSVVSLDYSAPRPMPYSRLIAHELIAAADAERLSGNFDVALGIYLDVLTLADRAQRGGIEIDLSIGSGIETNSLRNVARLVPRLSSDQCRAAVERLLAYDDGREPIADVQRRDDLYEILSHGWPGRWRATVEAVHHSIFDHTVTVRFDGQRTRRRDQAWLRVVVCDLAIHAFWLEHRRLPTSLNELVPNYLPKVLFDPHLKGPKYTNPAADQYKLSALDLLDEIFCTIERKEGVNMGSPQ